MGIRMNPCERSIFDYIRNIPITRFDADEVLGTPRENYEILTIHRHSMDPSKMQTCSACDEIYAKRANKCVHCGHTAPLYFTRYPLEALVVILFTIYLLV